VIPYTTERRGDTGATNVTLGIWLFLASEVMLFGSLFSAYALVRASADHWPAGRDILQPSLGFVNTFVLLGGTASIWRARSRDALTAMGPLAASTFLAFVFLVLKGAEYRVDLAEGLRPSASMFLALYFTLTGLHAVHVVAGGLANAWVIAGTRRVPPALTMGRIHALARYWLFVDAIWVVLLVLFYLT
jgi:heme/copper-type cytochrome/quinol oxidase subunit 3